MPILKVIQSTVLKRDPTKQSGALPPDQKYPASAGTIFELTASTPSVNQHLQVELKQSLQGFTTWFAYAPHVAVVDTPIMRVIQPTVLKRDPTKQAASLPPDQKYAASVGTIFELTASTPSVNQHLQVELKQSLQGFTTWFVYAPHGTLIGVELNPLEVARDRTKIFNDFLAIEQQEGSNQNHLSFLDREIESSPYAGDIDSYPGRLRQLPDGQTVVSLGSQITLTDSSQVVSFGAYPQRGVIPSIDQTGLNFLHSDIKEACLCVGSLVNGEMRSHWLGKNALSGGEFWSSTKFVPILNLVCQANQMAPTTAIQDCVIRDSAGIAADLPFIDAAIDIISYRLDDIVNNINISNQMAAMMKRFSTRPNLEKWFSGITGNKSLRFQGYYGDDPFIENPRLCTSTSTLLSAPPDSGGGDNSVSAYDLTRVLSMLGWHLHIPQSARLPAAQWHSVETVVRAMGYDTARYIEAAIAVLGLQTVIREPVILSKLGFGPSTVRNRTELVFTGLVQFIDDRPRTRNQPSVFRTLALTLRTAVQKLDATGNRDLDEEARWLDARMAAEVTEVLRRIITQELA